MQPLFLGRFAFARFVHRAASTFRRLGQIAIFRIALPVHYESIKPQALALATEVAILQRIIGKAGSLLLILAVRRDEAH